MSVGTFDLPASSPAAALSAERESDAARVMLAYAATGIFFMLFPGTILGVANLIAISAGQTAGAISHGWVQAHGHAQIFGWIGTFIIGIGYRTLPSSLRRRLFGVDEAWISLGLWACGALMRWAVGVGAPGWRALLVGAALFELAGFGLFLRATAKHRPSGGARPGAWALVVIGGSGGLLLALLLQAKLALEAALWGDAPEFAADGNARFLVVAVWGFVLPFVWGFTARWVTTMLGLAEPRARHLLWAYLTSLAGVALSLAGWDALASGAFVVASTWVVFALRLYEPASDRLRIRGIHSSFPIFVRAAYAWLLVGAALGLWAATGSADMAGVAGASRHALTVGCMTTMVFSVAPRILPTFTLRRGLFSTRLMVASLVALTIGCAMRVVAEILAYQGYAHGAWRWLPVSALVELSAVALFALNMAASFLVVPKVTRRRYSPGGASLELIGGADTVVDAKGR
jgi:hypothetical protein